MVKYGVLVTGDVHAPIAAVHGDFGDHFVTLLFEGAVSGDQYRLYRVNHGEFPDEDALETVEAWAITGGSGDAHSTDEWVVRTRALVARIHSNEQARILGVCLGHQLLAIALGGASGPAPAELGWNCGSTELTLCSVDEVATAKATCPEATKLIDWASQNKWVTVKSHRDQVSKLPPGAIPIASSPRCRYESYVLPRVLAIQGHPEFTAAFSRELFKHDSEIGCYSKDDADSFITALNASAVDCNPPELKECLRAFFFGNKEA